MKVLRFLSAAVLAGVTLSEAEAARNGDALVIVPEDWGEERLSSPFARRDELAIAPPARAEVPFPSPLSEVETLEALNGLPHLVWPRPVHHHNRRPYPLAELWPGESRGWA